MTRRLEDSIILLGTAIAALFAMTSLFHYRHTVPMVAMALYVVASVGLVGRGFRRLDRELIHYERFSSGLCVRCGYDLRGGTAACPECGTPIGPLPDQVIDKKPPMHPYSYLAWVVPVAVLLGCVVERFMEMYLWPSR